MRENKNQELIEASKNYKIIKRYKSRGNSHEVVLLLSPSNEKIIRKSYNSNKKAHHESFEREIRILTRLESEGFAYVPKLLAIDYKNKTFYQNYCGSTPPDTPEYRKKAELRTRELSNKHGFRYIRNGRQIFVVFWGNYCLNPDNDEIYLIDFGATRWHEPNRKTLKPKKDTKNVKPKCKCKNKN